MIDKITSVLLVSLVGLSLFLTYQLWYGQTPAQLLEEEVYERIMVEQPRLLEDVVTPYKIITKAENGLYVLQAEEDDYEKLWGALSYTLQRISVDAVESEHEFAEGTEKLLTYHFHPELPVGDNLPWFPEASYNEIHSIELLNDDDKIWLSLEGSGDHDFTTLLLPPGKVKLFSEALEEINYEDKATNIRVANEQLAALNNTDIEVEGLLYVPVDPVYMNALNLSPEEIEHDIILKTFFVDYNMARIIEEKEGGMIYTDGSRGLRLKNTGLEYSAPQKEEGRVSVTYADALANSSSLISYHGGWPRGLRLEKVNLTGWGGSAYYQVEWRMYYEGFPIYTIHPTIALFNDSGLVHYARSIFVHESDIIQEEQQPVAAWQEALDEAFRLYKEKSRGELNRVILNEMTLGYVVTETIQGYQGIPVWMIKINNELILLQANQLKLVEEEDLL